MSLFSTAISAANPYLFWIKIGAATIVVGMILGSVWYVRSAFAERDSLRVEKTTLTQKLDLQVAQTAIITTQFNSYIQLQKETVEAIKKIKVQSDVYVQGVEDEKKPVSVDGAPIAFIPAGLPRASNLSGTANNITSGTAVDP